VISLLIAEIADRYVQENFNRLKNFFQNQPFLKGQWRFIEIDLDNGVTNFKYKHNLGFIPKDVILTSITPSVSVVWNYDSFDREFIDFTTSGACVIRAFIGSYIEGSQA
jgi:hypothetical protein